MESISQSDSASFIDQFTQFFALTSDSFLDQISRLNFFILLPILFAVSAFLIGYFKNYQKPANLIRQHLGDLIEEIRTARHKLKNSPEVFERVLNNIFSASPFKSLWNEYCASLHVVEGRNGVK